MSLLKTRTLLAVGCFLLAACSANGATVSIVEGFSATGVLPVADMTLGSVALFQLNPAPAVTDLLVFVPVTDAGGTRTGTGYAFCSADNIDPNTIGICSAAPQPYDVVLPRTETPSPVAPGVFGLVTFYLPGAGQPGFSPSLSPQVTFMLVNNTVFAPEPASAALLIPGLLGLALLRRGPRGSRRRPHATTD